MDYFLVNFVGSCICCSFLPVYTGRDADPNMCASGPSHMLWHTKHTKTLPSVTVLQMAN